MEALALYLLKVHVGVSLLYAIYYLTVRNELYFQLNRFVLLAVLLLSFTLPLLPSLSIDPQIQSSSTIPKSMLGSNISADPIKGKEIARFDDEIQIKRLSGIVTSLMAFYLCAVVFFFLKFFGQVSNVIALITTSEKVNADDSSYLDPGENIPAFSFFNHIVINRYQHDDEQLRLIIAHERAHVNQLHSVDIIAVELASVLLWGNPLVKSLKNTIRMNLEFLADQQVLKEGFDKKAYQWSIVTPYLQQNAYPLTNLYSSKPKQRIERMNAKGKPLLNLIKYVFIIPIIAAVYAVVTPFHASALDKIKTMKLINDHEYHDYLGYYEFERDKGSFVRIMMKDETLIMNTLWNNKKIFFRKQSENGFINTESAITLAFPRNFEGAVKVLVAFGDDRWTKVQKYVPVKKRSGEGTVISRTSSGGIQVMVYAVEPWANVKNYSVKNTVSSP
jgi:hypothetical protein